MSLEQHSATTIGLANLAENDIIPPAEQHSIPLNHGIEAEKYQGIII